MPGELIFKIMTQSQLHEFENRGSFRGAAVDLHDGYIHFSYADQLAETARKHFAGQTELVIVAVDTAMLGTALRAEPSRGGNLFPHLYAPLPIEAVQWVTPLSWQPDGEPVWNEP